ncbi:6929_t:CDS:2 [Ambispora gerdemannii]|uniref:DASH complex subunit DAD4 n=1 Tax=Ambispora gerdemannii TaxID=144530 RepID=A0A9N9CM79_9GLOM|nr:6929_t:CDS:2 [Ambispora gerdemannii]
MNNNARTTFSNNNNDYNNVGNPQKIGNPVNPHEEQQNSLLTRVVSHVQKLNDVMVEVTMRLQEINEYNRDIVTLSQVWGNYMRNVAFNLESIQRLDDPK